MLAAQVARRCWGSSEFSGIDMAAACDTVNVRRVPQLSLTGLGRFAFPSGQAFLALHEARCSSTLGVATTSAASPAPFACRIGRLTAQGALALAAYGGERRDSPVASRKQ